MTISLYKWVNQEKWLQDMKMWTLHGFDTFRKDHLQSGTTLGTKQENGKTVAIDSVEYKSLFHFLGWTKKLPVVPRVEAMFGFKS